LWNGLDVRIGKGALYSFYSIGEVEIATDLDDSQKQMLSKNLNSIGFELDDKENKTVERIKTESLTWYIIKRNN
jgi:hypothetical protein